MEAEGWTLPYKTGILGEIGTLSYETGLWTGTTFFSGTFINLASATSFFFLSPKVIKLDTFLTMGGFSIGFTTFSAEIDF